MASLNDATTSGAAFFWWISGSLARQVHPKTRPKQKGLPRSWKLSITTYWRWYLAWARRSRQIALDWIRISTSVCWPSHRIQRSDSDTLGTGSRDVSMQVCVGPTFSEFLSARGINPFHASEFGTFFSLKPSSLNISFCSFSYSSRSLQIARDLNLIHPPWVLFVARANDLRSCGSVTAILNQSNDVPRLNTVMAERLLLGFLRKRTKSSVSQDASL